MQNVNSILSKNNKQDICLRKVNIYALCLSTFYSLLSLLFPDNLDDIAISGGRHRMFGRQEAEPL